MTKLTIITPPDPRLKQKAEPVAYVDDTVRKILEDMMETMYDAQGCGLAANQVGILQRMLVMDCGYGDKPPAPLRLVNPEIIAHSETTASMEEACLSLPDVLVEITRPENVRVRYLDENGTLQERFMEGLEGVCVQHEIDHLNGVLTIDSLSELKKSLALRRIEKAVQSHA